MTRIVPLLMLAGIWSNSVCAVNTDMQQEIDHLLKFVAMTDCHYIRNGSEYNGKEAVNHIKRKYDYFKDEIDSTEKFIELSASKSTMSGKYYMVKCDGKPKIRSQQWLLRELGKYRNAES